jgi:hypothetical protein
LVLTVPKRKTTSCRTLVADKHQCQPVLKEGPEQSVGKSLAMVSRRTR